MHHVVLGAGGVGGLLAAVLARAGEQVTTVVRPATARLHPDTFTLSSRVFGDFRAEVDVADATPFGADVVWVTVKAGGLSQALDLAPPQRVADATVVPLLNGIDHMGVLRARYARVCAATIRVESHRVAAGVIEQRSPFARISLATTHDAHTTDVAAVLARAGFATSTSDDETTLLWDKLAFLAPIALATTAWNRALGGVRAEPLFQQCCEETVRAARRDGAATDLDVVRRLIDAAPDSMRSSMQVDVEAGREPELDAIAGAIVRRAPAEATTATRSLVDLVSYRLRKERWSHAR